MYPKDLCWAQSCSISIQNDLFLFIKQATLYNYADDNTLTYFSKSMPDLINTLEKETGVALTWLEQNEMIANPEKFHALLLRKKSNKYQWRTD